MEGYRGGHGPAAPHPKRLFIALPPPEEVKGRLQEVQRALKPALPAGAVRWVKPAGFHLTLEFLGDTAEEELEELAQTLQRAAARTAPFTLTLGGLDSFGRPPRVLYVRVGGELAALGALREHVARSFRPFTPHLTLGRVRPPRPLSLPALLVPPTSWRATHVRLFESTLEPGGARYTPLVTAPFGEGLNVP